MNSHTSLNCQSDNSQSLISTAGCQFGPGLLIAVLGVEMEKMDVKYLILTFSIIIYSSLGYCDNSRLQYADIGFQDIGYYIKIEFSNLEDGLGYQFAFCKTDVGSCAELNSCKYLEKKLIDEVSLISNVKVKNDFDWIFFRSDYASVKLQDFYLEFTKLLLRANPMCEVPGLQQMKDKVRVQSG